MLDSATRRSVAATSFLGHDGAMEHHLAIAAPAHLDLAGQMAAVADRYAGACRDLGLSPETAVFRRIFVSDYQNQREAVLASPLCREDPAHPVAVSIVQQPPLPAAKVALLAYHVVQTAPEIRRRLDGHHLLIERNGLGHLWSTRLCAANTSPQVSAAGQTRAVFAALTDALAGRGGTLHDHCVRTWIYVRDVDVFYLDMVASRTELFERQGLTADTHYIASTGIEGACAHQFDVIAMDAYSLLGQGPGQMSYLNDFSRMCHTRDYQVTFERGTRIAYRDRAHHFISGTASIDRRGQVLHPGDVLAQLDRALLNVDAILRSGGTSIDAMMHLIVYLRDPSDFARVEARLKDRFPALPAIVVQGAVCRPDWLVEIEGIATAPHRDDTMPAF
jgi:enamine deaminase RidA (YjgF/YER057c/UK114 family)